MPEGPSIIILKEAVEPFARKKILSATGYADINKSLLKNKTITSIKTWGKQLLICFPGNITIRIHLMLFGSYRINEKRNANPKLHLHFSTGDIYFYACDIKLLKEDLNTLYDWSADIMNDKWNARKARKKLNDSPDMLVCDALMSQSIFSGAGNIIKSEVLFRTRIHPESVVRDIPTQKLTALIKEVRKYSFQFLEWKKANVLSKHWEAYAKKTCPRCKIPLVKKPTGKTKRRSFFCENCQVLYGKPNIIRKNRPAKKKVRKV